MWCRNPIARLRQLSFAGRRGGGRLGPGDHGGVYPVGSCFVQRGAEA